MGLGIKRSERHGHRPKSADILLTHGAPFDVTGKGSLDGGGPHRVEGDMHG